MPGVAPVGTSGFTSVDGLLHDVKWNTLSLTFSFPDAATLWPLDYPEPFDNYGLFNDVQKDAVRAIYPQISSFTNLTFAEVSASAGDLRFAMSDHHAGGFGYFPHPHQSGGDSWYNNSSGLYDDPQVGRYAFLALLHEIGHTLGLRHPHDEPPLMPPEADALEFTVMSYRSYVGDDLGPAGNETNGFPQTYMMYDIYALQHLYGANYTSNAGDTLYQWSPSTGAFFVNGALQWTPAGNRVFMTVWDGNGTDTYDLSNYTNAMTINLRPGRWSDISAAQFANLGDGKFANGNVFNAFLFQGDTRSLIENAIGGTGADLIVGNEGPNTLEGRGGDDLIFGEGGNDVLIGGTGADEMEGVGGNDIYHVDASGDEVREFSGGGTDRIVSTITLTLPDHVEQLTLGGTSPISGIGNGLDNILVGNDAANSLNGGLGSDTLDGGGGADTMTGGAGHDTYVVDNPSDQARETSASDGTDMVKSEISFTLPAFIEKLVLSGNAAIGGTGNELANAITGNGAANALGGGGGDDMLDGKGGADTMIGGDGNDGYFVDDPGDRAVETSAVGGSDAVTSSVSFTLGANVEKLALTGTARTGIGNAVANTIEGNGAANTLNGKGGADLMKGGGGNDTYYVDKAGDRVVEAAGGGVDLVNSKVSFTLGANIEKLTLTGGAAVSGFGNGLANILTGNSAANVLNGRGGADMMTGFGGDDSYFVDNALDQVVEAGSAGGTDTVNSKVSYTLRANLENLKLTGSAAIDGTGNGLGNQIVGNDSANRLIGWTGSDTLRGRGGADELRGGKGDDTLAGGGQADRFVFDTGLATDNVDRILDFQRGSDKIVLENAIFKGIGASAFAAEALVVGAAAGDADDRIIYNPGTGALLYDPDGAGGAAAVRFAVLDTQPASLAASDFLVI